MIQQVKSQIAQEEKARLDNRMRYIQQDGNIVHIKAGNADCIKHDPQLLYFVVKYKERYGNIPSFEEAVRLYREYDADWEHEVLEYEQTMSYVRDTDARESALKW